MLNGVTCQAKTEVTDTLRTSGTQKSQREFWECSFSCEPERYIHPDHHHQQVVHFFSCTRHCIWHKKKKKKIQKGTDSPQLVIWVCSKLICCIFPRGIVINGGGGGCSQMNQKQKIKIYLIYTWVWPTFSANG